MIYQSFCASRSDPAATSALILCFNCKLSPSAACIPQSALLSAVLSTECRYVFGVGSTYLCQWQYLVRIVGK